MIECTREAGAAEGVPADRGHGLEQQAHAQQALQLLRDGAATRRVQQHSQH